MFPVAGTLSHVMKRALEIFTSQRVTSEKAKFSRSLKLAFKLSCSMPQDIKAKYTGKLVCIRHPIDEPRNWEKRTNNPKHLERIAQKQRVRTHQ